MRRVLHHKTISTWAVGVRRLRVNISIIMATQERKWHPDKEDRTCRTLKQNHDIENTSLDHTSKQTLHPSWSKYRSQSSCWV